MSDPGGPPPAPRVPTLEDFPETGANALAGFGQRAFGRTIDALLVWLPLYLVAVMVSGVVATEGSGSGEEVASLYDLAPWFAVAWVVAAFVYETAAVALFGVTVGKVASRTRVARYADGATPTWEQAALRSLVPLAACVGLFLLVGSIAPAVRDIVVGAALVYFSALTDPLGRGWHDKAGGTVVIRTR